MMEETKQKDVEDWIAESVKVPQHWVNANFDNVFSSLSINDLKIPQKDYLVEGEFPVIDQGAELIGGYTNNANKVLIVENPVIVFGDHTRCIKFVDFNFAPGADGIKVLRPHEPLNSKYLFYASKILKLPNRGYSRHFSFLKKSLIPIASLNEQKRIVAKIEELFSELDSGIEKLKTARAQLKVYRQAVLKYAFEGKLTAPWRKKNKIEFKQEKIKFIELCESSQNGLSKRSGNDGVMIPVIRLADITSEEIDLSDLREIRLSEGERTKYQLLPNDLLCIRVNGSPSLVGRLVLIKTDRDLAYCDHFIRFRINGKTTAKFIKYFFNTPQARRYIDLNKVSSAGQNTVSQKTIGDIEIPKFSIEEQTQIAMEIEARLSLVDKIEETIDTELQKSEALRQSILKKAFSGQLVAQNPADEPANVLLERIRNEKATPKPTVKKTKEKRRVA